MPARWLVPRMRAARGSGREFRFLTGPGAIGRFLTAPFRRNRLLDEATGELVVGAEGGAQRRAGVGVGGSGGGGGSATSGATVPPVAAVEPLPRGRKQQ